MAWFLGPGKKLLLDLPDGFVLLSHPPTLYVTEVLVSLRRVLSKSGQQFEPFIVYFT
jgi:hypothetical protein